MNKFYVTTPIYYVNDVPHIGHAYTTVACDVLSRFNRLLGNEVFFLTGTDEHGQKVQKSALEKSLDPKAHADKLVENFKQLWVRLNITNDAFIRTTDKAHIQVVQELLSRLKDCGEIVKREYSGWYCTHEEMFFADSDLIGNNCPQCGRAVDFIREDNYFFLMSKYQAPLIDYIEKNPEYILPESRRNEALGFLKNQTLGDLCISRPKSRLSWGAPLPFDENYVTYVWFDALTNYYSATRYLAPKSDVSWWPVTHHIIGKDILITHSIYWSTMLMALKMPLPGNIFAHGWWTVDGTKMSKSLGNAVDPVEMTQLFGADSFRYFLLRETLFGSDGNFSKDAFIGKINSELANDFGNLASRILAMVGKYYGGQIPTASHEETELKELAEGLLKRLQDSLRTLNFQLALQQIWELVSYVNKYIDRSAPWTLAKSPDNREKLNSVMYAALESLRFLAMYLNPFMPHATQKLWEQLGLDSDLSKIHLPKQAAWGFLKPGASIQKGEQLFPRVDVKNLL
jgi:methionyl-tRNA synthetase